MREFSRVICEGAIIAVVGIGIGVFANSRNPDGIALNRRPLMVPPPPPATGATSSATAPSPTDAGNAQIKRMVIDLGFKVLEGPEAGQLFRDPKYAQGIYLFLDARSDDEYQAGHVPGAHHIYANLNDEGTKQSLYEAFKNLSLGAEKIVVYCNGGHCDDSIIVAQELPQRGVDPGKIYVDLDGMAAWRKAGLPRERGARNSGDIVEGNK